MNVHKWSHLVGADPAALIAQARHRAEELGLVVSSNDHRNVINMFRHDYSGYDAFVPRSRTDRLYSDILDEIAQDFPWLAAQCEQDKATHFQRLDPRIQARRYAHEDGLAKQKAAREVIKELLVGDKVMVKWRGSREAEVIKIRRSRIKAAFTLDDGSRHVIDRSAHEVEPVKADPAP